MEPRPRSARSLVPTLAVALTAASIFAGCGGEASLDADVGVVRDASAPPEGDAPDAGCVPITCDADRCGRVADGCGGTLECGMCDCTPSTFTTDCPEQPCEVAVGCDGGTCRYEPVTCDFIRCTCAEGTTCDDRAPRGCGPGCADTICDPQPSDATGRRTYGNVCLPREEVRCGFCALGEYTCGAGDQLVCETPSFDWIDGAAIECDGSSPVADVLYVDPLVAGTGNGSRELPFQTLAEALAVAPVRDVELIFVGRSPRIEGTLVLTNGVSIIGGFDGWPHWRVDDAERPVFHARESDAREGRLVGVLAERITTPTRLMHVRVETDDLTGDDGASNLGIVAREAPALQLVDVEVHVGYAADGVDGANGVVPVAPPRDGVVGAVGFENPARPCSTVIPGGTPTPVYCDGVRRPDLDGGAGGSSGPVPAGPRSAFPGADAPSGALGGLGYDSLVRVDAQSGAPVAWTPPLLLPAEFSFTWTDGLPVPTGVGRRGFRGLDGNGGGGGATGMIWNSPPNCRVGGSGGSGGGGGCGGNPGLGGGPGGLDVGLTIASSAGIELSDLVIELSDGGRGGAGGTGSSGTPGGAGAEGGGPPSLFQPDWYGRRGGDGSAGSAGSAGAAGSYGIAVGVMCESATSIDGVAVTAVRTFDMERGCL